MIEVKIPKEIRQYREKIFGIFTLRQVICIAIILIGSTTIGLLLSKAGANNDIVFLCIMIFAVPFFLIGFFRYEDMNFEEYAVIVFISTVLYPAKRVYESDHVYNDILEEYLEELREEGSSTGAVGKKVPHSAEVKNSSDHGESGESYKEDSYDGDDQQ